MSFVHLSIYLSLKKLTAQVPELVKNTALELITSNILFPAQKLLTVIILKYAPFSKIEREVYKLH